MTRAGWLVLLGLFWVETALAADARELFQQGVALANEEKWKEALEKFEASYAQVKRPSTLFNIGSTLIKLDRPTEAIRRLERFMEVSEAASERSAASKLIAEAGTARVRLVVEVAPADLTLEVDGEPIEGGAVRTVEGDPGVRVVEAAKPGFESQKTSLALKRGEARTLKLALTPLASPPPPSPPPPPPAVPPPPIVEEPLQPAPKGSLVDSPWFWVITASVLVAGGIAVGVAVGTQGEDPYGGTGMRVLKL